MVSVVLVLERIFGNIVLLCRVIWCVILIGVVWGGWMGNLCVIVRCRWCNLW